MTPKSIRLLATLLALAALAAAPVAAAQAPPAPDRQSERFVTGEAIVRFVPGTGVADRRRAREAAGAEFERSLAVPRAQLVEVGGGVEAAVRRLERRPEVAYAQPNYRYSALGHAPDSFLGELWGLSDTALAPHGVNALEAWKTSRGGGRVIAVIDTGVDLTHPDLAPNLWSNPGETPGNDLDDDENGVVDDVHGADFVDRAGTAATGDPDDYNFHGTHVAGTAAAEDDNGLGIAGVAPDAQIMAVRALDGDGSGTSEDIGDGIAYAARQGADVINLSLGGTGSSDPYMSDGVDVAAEREAVVVAAAGNNGSNNDATPFVPCSLPQENLICVAALNQAGNRASFSNYGLGSVDVAAPGTSILSAKTDWGAPLLSEGFNGALDAWEQFGNSGQPWQPTNAAGRFTEGTHSVTDSPAGNYANNLFTWLSTAAAVDLTGERGCRMHFDLDHEIRSGDWFSAGAVTNGPYALADFTGDSGGFFDAEVSLSALDGRTDVYPSFVLETNASGRADGAYVDRLRLFCRDSTYVDDVVHVDDYDQADSGNYVRFGGTSMAAPHVAGVAALVRAADPGATAVQVVQALVEGVHPLASLSGLVRSGGTLDAVGALGASPAPPDTEQDDATPASGGGGTTTTSGSGAGPPPATGTLPATGTQPAAPAKALLPARAVADRRGRLRIRVGGDAGTAGLLRLTTRGPRGSAVRSVARKSFTMGGRGRAIVRVRLTRAARRALVRRKRLRVRARVVLKNEAGLRSSAARVVRVRLRR